MGIFNRDEEVRQHPLHGVTFSIEPDAFKCNLGDNRVCFGENCTFRQFDGTTFNHQPILIDGVDCGYLREVQFWNIFEPMTVSFIYPFNDEKEITRKMRKSPHFVGDMGYNNPAMQFGTLQQFVDFVLNNTSHATN